MGLFDRFKRKPKVVLPEEVSSYYQSERRERVGVAVIIGIAALIATLLIAAGLFYGGRYAYRQIKGSDTSTTSQQQAGDQEVSPEDVAGQRPEANDNNDQRQGDNGAPSGTEGQVGSPTNPTTPTSPTTPPATSNQTMPSLGDGPLPRTGDEGM